MSLPSSSRRRFVKRSLAASLLLGGGGSLLAACGDDDDTGAQTADTTGGAGDTTSTTALERSSLTAVMPFQVSLNFIADMAAVAGGIMGQHGLDLDLQFARSAPQASQQLAAGNATLIRNAPIAVAKAVGEGAPFVSFGMPVQQLLYVLISTPDAPATSLQDLVGKTVGLPTLGSQAEELLGMLMRSEGLDPASVSLQAVGNETTSYALVEEGRVDAIFGTREAAAIMESAGLTPNVAELDAVNPLLGVALVTTRENLEARREDLVRYLQAMAESMRAIRAGGNQELLDAVADEYDLSDLKQPDEVDRTVLDTISGMWVSEGDENLLRNIPENWEAGVEVFKRLKIVPADAQATDFYTNELWDEAFA